MATEEATHFTSVDQTADPAFFLAQIGGSSTGGTPSHGEPAAPLPALAAFFAPAGPVVAEIKLY